jgi:hypothetical protein
MDYLNRVTDQIQAVRASTSGKLLTNDSFAQTTWVRWQKTNFDGNARRTYERVYHNIPSSGEGSSGTNYHQTDYAYNSMARVIDRKSPGGTIHWTVYHAKGWVKEQWVGTDDTGATESNPAGSGSNNMKKVASYEYDGNSVGGDGMLTKETRHVNDSTNRETTFTYDYRHRRLTMSAPENRYEAYTLRRRWACSPSPH